MHKHGPDVKIAFRSLSYVMAWRDNETASVFARDASARSRLCHVCNEPNTALSGQDGIVISHGKRLASVMAIGTNKAQLSFI